MTLASALLGRVRTNINEPSGQTDPLRTDAEIYRWLEDGQHDLVAKIPADAVPELLTSSGFTGASWAIPANFIKLVNIVVWHTISGTVTETTQCSELGSDESYLIHHYIGGVGAWCQFQDNVIVTGPNVISGTTRYVKNPTDLTTSSTGNVAFAIGAEFEEPVVNYATAMAMHKVNDPDAERFLDAYLGRINAEREKYGLDLIAEPQ